MKNSFLKTFWMVAASFFLVNPAFSENTVTVNVIGVPYMQTLYMALADDFASLENPLFLKYSGGKTEEFAKSVASGAVDFSVSDIPLTGKELDERKLIQFPSMVTAIVPVVNIPGVESNKLVLNGAVLAKIMAGEITVWNDESIRALNPGMSLPSIRIKPLARSDASGATLAISSFLSKSSAEFNTKIGAGELVRWPSTVQLLPSGEALETAIHDAVGAVSYIEMDIGNIKRMTFVKLKHPTGSIVKADMGFLRSGVVGARTTEGGYGVRRLTTMDLGQNWPILLPIYIVLPQKAVNDKRMTLALRFIFWTFNKGDDSIEQSGLVPLPVELQTQAVKAFRKVQAVNGTPLIVSFEL